MKQKLFGWVRKDNKGLALISVLGLVTLATILILALFSLGQQEHKSARIFSAGNNAKQFADNAVQIVIGQIQSAAEGIGAASTLTMWASQPGAIRVYAPNGVFSMGRKLYSDDQMVVNRGTEQAFASDSSTDANFSNWSKFPDQYVDLNEPVSVNRSGTVELYFPILDPRAAAPYAGGGVSLAAVDGFEYYSSTGNNNGMSNSAGKSVSGVVVATAGNPAAARLPMPVQWLYFLRDGNTGVVNGAGKWTTSGVTPTAENPIIGRVAFWTDDETCKVNINTAAEPSIWNVPTVFAARDAAWADSPPRMYEYQRYPGHPATVAMSAVFTPPGNLYHPDTYPTPATVALNFKNALYTIAPKIAWGGSMDGTAVYELDDDSNKKTKSTALNMDEAFAEYRYGSVDELMWRQGMNGGKRNENRLVYGSYGMFSPEVIAQRRGFLTANSSASELNMYSRPRVTIWPVPHTSAARPPQLWTNRYDDAIAVASVLGKWRANGLNNSYYFQRESADSSLADIGRDASGKPGLLRNNQLMAYLHQMISQVMPGGASFISKYAATGGRNDADQVLVEIFDYIRTVNLYDGYLAKKYDEATKDRRLTAAELNEINVFEDARKLKNFYTYTEPRFEVARGRGSIAGLPTNVKYDSVKYVQTGMYPGHGQVRPSDWIPPGGGGLEYKGFGRFPTISEIALHFICTGDGLNDAGSHQIRTPTGLVISSGGMTAERIDTTIVNDRKVLVNPLDRSKKRYWYSNIPPFPSQQLFQSWGCSWPPGSGLPTDPTRHPAWDSSNWNATLQFNNTTQSGVPLATNEKRIQAALTIEVFVPAVGWTKYAPEFTLVLNKAQLAGIKITNALENGNNVAPVPLFESTEDRTYKSGALHMNSVTGLAYNGINAMGGSYGSTPFMSSRVVKSIGKMPPDDNYPLPGGAASSDIRAFNLVSSFFTVQRDRGSPDRPASIKFSGGGNINIDVYASHAYQGGTQNKADSLPVQSIEFKIPDGEVPVPHLVVYSSEHREWQDGSGNRYEARAINACRWWSFNRNGAIGRWRGIGNPRGQTWSFVTPAPTSDEGDTFGRFFTGSLVHTSVPSLGTNGNVPHGYSVIYGYAANGNYSGVKAQRKDISLLGNNYRPSGRLEEAGTYNFFGSDSIKSVVPKHGDYRILAGRKKVPADVWKKHPVWEKDEQEFFAHSLNSFNSADELGYDMGGMQASGAIPGDSQKEVPTNRLVSGAWYPRHQIPDTPNDPAASKWSTKYRDFDNGPGNIRDGAYINKPDDGNLSVMDLWFGQTNKVQTVRNAYFIDSQLQLPSKDSFFTPNRMLVGPGMFGSLSTGVYGSRPGAEPNGGIAGVPWRTLLFRASTGEGHVGAPAHAGGFSPADHYFMDLFTMPIVEPYPISNCFSSAGKVNLNWQLLPFSHIRRETALRAAMKDVIITAFGPDDAVNGNKQKGKPNANGGYRAAYKTLKSSGGQFPLNYWSEADGFFWERRLNIPETLKQLEERFMFHPTVPAAAQGLMRTSSQLCELHLIPTSNGNDGLRPNGAAYDPVSRSSAMAQFWNTRNTITGDNTRERPYANLCQKLSTKSNSYRVFFIAQSLLKAKSLGPDTVDTTADTISATYRGSALLERYLDNRRTDYPDYAAAAVAGSGSGMLNSDSLEKFYRYRILEFKQFVP